MDINKSVTTVFRLIIRCRKCEGLQTLLFPDTYGPDKIFRKINMITESSCPYCGEDPYDNWLLYDVKKMSVKGKTKDNVKAYAGKDAPTH